MLGKDFLVKTNIRHHAIIVKDYKMPIEKKHPTLSNNQTTDHAVIQHTFHNYDFFIYHTQHNMTFSLM